jgi:RimJ/RimL family protein N-acetyltransferase
LEREYAVHAKFNEFGQPIGPYLENWEARAARPERVALKGQYCHLKPLDATIHGPELWAAYSAAPDNRLWTYLFAGPFSDAGQFDEHVQRAARSVDPLHFAVIDAGSMKALGTMSLMRMDPCNGVIEVGNIAFSPELQRSRVATEAQYLLMKLVFDDLKYRRYEWKCDHLNEPSRQAALRLGFKFEGIFRQAVVYKNRSRDTAWFSIIDTDWRDLSTVFRKWLAPQNFDGTRQKRSLASFRTGLP